MKSLFIVLLLCTSVTLGQEVKGTEINDSCNCDAERDVVQRLKDFFAEVMTQVEILNWPRVFIKDGRALLVILAIMAVMIIDIIKVTRL